MSETSNEVVENPVPENDGTTEKKSKKKKIIRRIIIAAVVIGVAVFLGQWIVPAVLKALFL